MFTIDVHPSQNGSRPLDMADNIGNAVAAAGVALKRRPHLREAPDTFLADEARQGDQGAALVLVARHEARLRSMATRAYVDAAPRADLMQAALEGLLEGVAAFEGRNGADVFTLAWSYVGRALRRANREAGDKAAPGQAETRYWASIDYADGFARRNRTEPSDYVARRWSGMQRESLAVLETYAEAGTDADALIARDIVNARVDRYDALVRKGEAPEWSAYANAEGRDLPDRGLTGPAWDAIHAQVTYIDHPGLNEEGEPVDFAEPESADPYEVVHARLAVAALLPTLDERAREVLTLRYGLDGAEAMEQRDVARKLGCSQQTVSRVERAALENLREIA